MTCIVSALAILPTSHRDIQAAQIAGALGGRICLPRAQPISIRRTLGATSAA